MKTDFVLITLLSFSHLLESYLQLISQSAPGKGVADALFKL